MKVAWLLTMFLFIQSENVFVHSDVKITKFGDTVEARSVHCSSLLSLVHPYEQLISKGILSLLVLSQAFGILYIFNVQIRNYKLEKSGEVKHF